MSSDATERRARILILIKGLGIGGAERLVSNSMRERDDSRFEYLVTYVLPWKNQLVDDIRSSGVDVECVGGSRGLDLRTPMRLRSLVSNWDADLVHAHLPSAGILARLSASRPVVYTEHNITSSYRQPTRAMNRITYGRNSAVAAVSQAVADSLEGYPGPSPRVIPNGVGLTPSGQSGSIKSELGIPSGTPLAIHVGNIRPHKGHSTLIEAAALLRQRGTEVQFVSIGGEKTQGDLERVRRQAAEAGVADRLRFLGRRENATDFIEAADVVVNPSDFEGLPVVLLEALSLSRPVVATAVGGVPSLILHEETGLLVPPGDAPALADAVDRALSDPHAVDWGRAGARLIRDNHSIGHMTRAYEQLYTEVLRG